MIQRMEEDAVHQAKKPENWMYEDDKPLKTSILYRSNASSQPMESLSYRGLRCTYLISL